MAGIKRANTSGITKTGIAIPDVVDAPTIGTASVATGQAYTGSANASVPFTPQTTGGAASSYTVTSSSGNTASGASSPIAVSDTVGTARTYTVRGVNSSGTWAVSSASNSVTPLSVPQAPTVGTPTNAAGQSYTGSATISVPFTANATGGATITGYTVTSSSGNTNTGASSPITVSETVGNPTSTARTYTVTAANSQGTSAASSASSSVSASSVPQAPTIGTATDLGTGTTATVAYTANATGGSAVSAYTATSSPGGFTGTGASPITVSGLTAGTAYTFTVTATNANGTSAASSASNSVTPALPPSYESIATQTPNGVGTITFSSIPQTYKHLEIRWIATHSLEGSDMYMRFNGVTTNTYSWRYLVGQGGTVGQSGTGANNTPVVWTGTVPTYFQTGVISITDYSSTTKLKQYKAYAGANKNNSTLSTNQMISGGQQYTLTPAITSITIFFSGGNFGANSTVALYGIKG